MGILIGCSHKFNIAILRKLNKRQLAFVLKYSSPKTILIIDAYGLLKQLETPFKVVAKRSVGNLSKGQIVLVSGVKVTDRLITIYLIGDKQYYYYYFDIF